MRKVPEIAQLAVSVDKDVVEQTRKENDIPLSLLLMLNVIWPFADISGLSGLILPSFSEIFSSVLTHRPLL